MNGAFALFCSLLFFFFFGVAWLSRARWGKNGKERRGGGGVDEKRRM